MKNYHAYNHSGGSVVAPDKEAAPAADQTAEQVSGAADVDTDASESTAAPEPIVTQVPGQPTYINGILVANKQYGLPQDYAPGESKEARSEFNRMAADAKQAGIELEAFSTYRSYDYQKKLYNSYVARDGQAAADRDSAKPGHSEHQTGLGFVISEAGRPDTRFEESNATRWMADHAHKYGFIVRYPKGKEHITGYQYEPWHFRYFGVEIATDVYESGLSLEEYLGID